MAPTAAIDPVQAHVEPQAVTRGTGLRRAHGSMHRVCGVVWYDGWMVSGVPEVRGHLQPLPTAKKCTRSHCREVHESLKGEVPVEGGLRRHGLSARSSTATVHKEVKVGPP